MLRGVDPLPRAVYFDALGRLIDAGRVRFDAGRYSAAQADAPAPPERHEIVEDASVSSSPFSPLSPVDPRKAYADALDRLGRSDAVGYDALTLSHAELAGAALRFLLPGAAGTPALTPLERSVRAALEAAGTINARTGTWVDHHTPTPTAYGRTRKGAALEPAEAPPGMLEGTRAAAVARIAAWRSAGETYGMLSVYRPRKGGVGAITLKVVRPVGTEETHAGFVCSQTSQFKVSDLRDAIRVESGKDAPESATSKPELCDRLGAALLARKRLLTPLEASLLGK